MSSYPNLKIWGESSDEQEKKYLYMLSVKTQFAGSSMHKLLINLLKYLSKKYFCEFNLYDEGKYWETGDEILLDEIFSNYNFLLDSFDYALKNEPIKDGENFETYFLRIIQQINDKRKK